MPTEKQVLEKTTPSTSFDSLVTASKWASYNAEWQNKISSLCLKTVTGYSEEAPSILWVYHSYAYQYPLALVALIFFQWDCFFPENWTDFLFQELAEEIQSKIVYIYSIILAERVYKFVARAARVSREDRKLTAISFWS